MGPLFYDVALLHHVQTVAVYDGRQPMSHDYDRNARIFRKHLDRLLDYVLAV